MKSLNALFITLIIAMSFTFTSCQKSLLTLTDIGNVIPVCGGDTLLPKNFFWIDPDLKTWGLNESSLTGEIPVQTYELNGKATFNEMFLALNDDFRHLCLTPAQIMKFCEKFPAKLSRTGETFFLSQKDGKYFVFSVQVHDTGLMLWIDPLRWYDDYVWNGNGNQIICPC